MDFSERKWEKKAKETTADLSDSRMGARCYRAADAELDRALLGSEQRQLQQGMFL